MKLFEHPTTHDPTTHDVTTQGLTELPELPHDVTVPDDISGLEVPKEPGRRDHRVRWLGWMVAFVVLAVGAIVVGLIVRDDGTQTSETPSAYQLIQESIDQALLENQAATVQTPSAYQLIQESIDQALQENR